MNQRFKQSEQWQPLIRLFAQGKDDEAFKPVLWIGAGLSVAAGYPTTSQLIEQLRSKSVQPLPDFTPWDTSLPADSPQFSFTHWIQLFAQTNTYGRLNKALASVFTPLSNQPTPTHDSLVNLPFKTLFTTNYDELLEAALNQSGQPFNLLTHEQNLGLAQDKLISLYKIHGGMSNIREWTLDENSYQQFADHYPFLDAQLKNTLFPHPIVYIGCSMLDPRVIDWYRDCEKRKLLNQLEYSIVIIRKEDWQTLPEPLKALYQKAKVHPLLFDDFAQLPVLLQALKTELDAPEQTIDATADVIKDDPAKQQEQQERQEQQLDDLLYVTLAPLMVQAIANIWLKCDENTSVAAALKTVSGVRAQRKGEQAFSLLEDDFVELSKKRIGINTDFELKKNIFQAVTSQLEQFTPSWDILARVDFDPHALYNKWKMDHTPPEVLQLDENSRLLYDKTLKETCELIVDCSQALPSWTTSNLVEQLTQPTALFEQLQKELVRWHETKIDDIDEVIGLEEEYRRAVARRFDELRIFGINFGKHVRKYQLSVAYISLTTETDSNDVSEVLPTDEALTRFERLVILGEAGQGKTTLLQWLTVQCGRGAFTGDKTPWNDKVPVLIKLREVLNHPILPTVCDFYSLMVQNITPEQPHQDWFNAILAAKQAILMIDGFDEVPQSDRARVLNWIKVFCQQYEGNQIILTSRPSSYNGELNSEDFQVIQLQKMSRDAQQDFVAHWHHAVALEYDRTKPDALKQEGEHLLQQLNQQRTLRHLAENPLLCGVICLLHRDRNGYLPQDRTELYEATCQMFLDRRDREKKIIEEQAFQQLSYRDKVALLNDVAQWMTNEGKTSISPEQLIKRFEIKLQDLPQLNRVLSAADLQLFFLERSGLLLQVGASEIQFAHRSFQEFFTAKYLMAEKDWQVLNNNASKDYWHGTIQLAIGLCESKKDNEQFLNGLLEQAKDHEKLYEQSEAIPLYLLVLRCKESMREISPLFAERLTAIMPKIIPPPTAGIRDAVADAGDLALPYLKRGQQRAIQKDYYCAQALIEMGTAEAYILLIDYFKDQRPSYIKKISKEIEKMEQSVAMEARLGQLMLKTGIDKFPAEINYKMAFLTQEPRLIPVQTGVIEHNFGYWALSLGIKPLTRFIHLKKADLGHCDITSLLPLAGLTQLQELHLSFASITDWTPLVSLTQLHSLDLSYTQTHDLTPLAILTQLQELDLKQTQINDLTPLSDLIQLRRLHLEQTQINDLAPLARLTQLKSLYLDNTQIRYLPSLPRLTQLNEIFIREAKKEDLTIIEILMPNCEIHANRSYELITITNPFSNYAYSN